MTHRLNSILANAVLMLCVARSASGQQGDFSGRWTLVEERSTFQSSVGPIIFAPLGTDLKIHQDAEQIVIMPAGQFPRRWIARFDGAESSVTQQRGDIHARIDSRYRAEWRGTTLVVSVASVTVWDDGRRDAGNKTFEFSRNPDGTLNVASSDGERMRSSVFRWLEAVE